MKLTKEEVQHLLSLSDKELATVANRYNYTPKITIIERGEARQEKAPDWAVGFLDGWSEPESTFKFLKEKLGVDYISDGPRENQSDGECDNIFIHEDGKKVWGTFEVNDNYYSFECYVKVLRWALKKMLKELELTE